MFVTIGLLLSGPGVIDVDPRAEAVSPIAEVTLALVLFTDASFVRIGALRQDAGVVIRLLAVGLPLTIVLGTLVAAVAWQRPHWGWRCSSAAPWRRPMPLLDSR